MIDIYPPARPKVKRPSRSFGLNRTIGYSLTILALFAGVYFGLGFISQRIDSWLELEPLAIADNQSETINSSSELVSENRVENNNQTETTEETSGESDQTNSIQTNTEDNSTEETQEQAPAPVPEPEPALAAHSFKIRILNGNAIWGAATKLRDILVKDGFQVVSVGNAEKQNYQISYIYFKTGKTREAELVKKTLESDYSFTLEENSLLVGENDLLIVIGKK